MPDIDRQTEDYEKLAFEEERECLDSIEARIDALIQRCVSKIAPLRSDLSGWHAVDYEDIDRKRIAIGDLERYKEQKEEIEAFKPEPYFCHFELVLDGERSREFCIGDNQHELRDDNGVLVLGRWSPLRKVYINKTQKHFDIEVDGKKHSYDLRLRRMVQIKDAVLIGVSTEFDSADVTLEGQVVDPFLIAVLRDKRRDFKLTDIVKTIQQNQNDILERPIGESFVVQGCAGSGKTMILLHRLSYLAFNHPEADFSKYIVLTPNESFNRHIDELCEELDIGTITRLTVESYYVRLARRLARNDVRALPDKSGQGRQVPKIAVPADNVVSEYGLPTGYLSEIYSEPFAKSVRELFDIVKDEAIEKIEDGPVGKMLLAKGIPLPNGDGSPYDAYLAIVRACAKIRRDSASLREEVRIAKAARDEAAEKLDEVATAYNSASEMLEPARAAVEETAVPFYEAKKQELDELRRELSNAGARERNAQVAVESASEKAAEADRALAEAEANLSSARGLASQKVGAADVENDPAVIEGAREECSKEQEEVARLQSELNGIGLFGFGRRRAVRDELEQAEARLQTRYEELLKDAAEEHAAHVRIERAKRAEEAEAGHAEAVKATAEAHGAHTAALERLEKAGADRSELAARIGQIKSEVDLLSQPIEAFANDKYPNLAPMEELEALEAISPELADYARRCQRLTSVQARNLHLGENRIRNLTERLAEANDALGNAEEALRSDVDEDVLEEAERLGAMLDASVFDGLLDRELDTMRARFGVTAPEGRSYRHDLYLKALECILYYGPTQDDGASICIDEAQDLSAAEHILIRESVGPAAALNLYGDTGQLVFPYKGIGAWSDLPEGIITSRYDLNENYRNTQQITEYCNERLDMDVTAIGLRGAQVERLSLAAAVDELFALKGAKPGIRCAVIYKRGLSGAKERLEGLLGRDASYGLVDTSKVSVIPVEAAKGLEFDAVVVIDNEMTRNEQYLSFTRALDHLMVTHVKDARVGDHEEISSEIGQTIGASKLKSSAPKPHAPENSPKPRSSEPDDNPFFDLDFS